MATCWMFEGRSESGMRRCGAARVREDFRIAPFFGMVAAAERSSAEQRSGGKPQFLKFKELSAEWNCFKRTCAIFTEVTVHCLSIDAILPLIYPPSYLILS